MALAFLVWHFVGIVAALPSASEWASNGHTVAPVENGVLHSALGWTDCHPETVYRPSSTDEVADIIASVYLESGGPEDSLQSKKRYLVRASHDNFYSHNNLSCARGSADSAVHSISLDMTDLNGVLQYNDAASMVTVQAGMTFAELDSHLFELGLSLPGISMAPHLAGMSLGGALVTASHGSSLVGPASIASFIRSAILVDGTGAVRVLEEPGNLLEGSLGLLGMVTELTLSVVPAKKVAVKQMQEEDVRMAADLREIVARAQAAALDVTWSPAAGMYTARVWHEAEPAAVGEARSTFLHTELGWLDQVDRRLHHDQLDVHDQGGAMCEIIGDLSTLPTFSASVEGGENDIYGVSVGWLNHMAGTDCDAGVNCFWKRAKWTPTQFSIRSEDFSDWLDDVRAVLAHASGCPSFLFNFRFVLASESRLAMHAGRQVVAVEISTHSSLTGGSRLPVKQQALLEEIAQMTMCNYAGRPHWALATNRMFTGPCPVRDMYGDDFDTFLGEMASYDPRSLFLAPLFSAVIARQEGNFYPGCAMEGDCFCEENSHCGPGHVCAPGAVFTQFNVCKLRPKAPDEL